MQRRAGKFSMHSCPVAEYSDKECYETGLWNENTQYQPCSQHYLLLLRGRTSYHVYVLFVSIATSLPALVIFFSYR